MFSQRRCFKSEKVSNIHKSTQFLFGMLPIQSVLWNDSRNVTLWISDLFNSRIFWRYAQFSNFLVICSNLESFAEWIIWIGSSKDELFTNWVFPINSVVCWMIQCQWTILWSVWLALLYQFFTPVLSKKSLNKIFEWIRIFWVKEVVVKVIF